jgi:hypothetical protein
MAVQVDFASSCFVARLALMLLALQLPLALAFPVRKDKKLLLLAHEYP